MLLDAFNGGLIGAYLLVFRTYKVTMKDTQNLQISFTTLTLELLMVNMLKLFSLKWNKLNWKLNKIKSLKRFNNFKLNKFKFYHKNLFMFQHWLIFHLQIRIKQNTITHSVNQLTTKMNHEGFNKGIRSCSIKSTLYY